MRFISKTFLIMVLGALTAGVGCKSSNPNNNLTQGANDDAIKNLPDWFLSPPKGDASYLYSTATSTSRDMQMAINKAKTTAQTALAQSMRTKLGNVTKQFQEEVNSGEDSELLQQFTSATKVVTSEVLNGVAVEEQKLQNENGVWRAYVLMSLPIGAANAQLMEKVKANQALYTRFRATKAFEDLDEELKEYEAAQQ